MRWKAIQLYKRLLEGFSVEENVCCKYHLLSGIYQQIHFLK